MENVKVYQLNEYDAVAAETLEDAKDFYRATTGLSDEDAFYDYEPAEYPLDYQIWEDETKTKKQPLKEVVAEYWKGKPFIAFSMEY